MAATSPPYSRPDIVRGEQCAEAPLTMAVDAARNRPGPAAWAVAFGAYRNRLSGGGAEPQPGPVGQPGHPLRPEDGRQRTQQVGQPPGQDDGDPLGPERPQGTL